MWWGLAKFAFGGVGKQAVGFELFYFLIYYIKK
jgi:hypothetical protein